MRKAALPTVLLFAVVAIAVSVLTVTSGVVVLPVRYLPQVATGITYADQVVTAEYGGLEWLPLEGKLGRYLKSVSIESQDGYTITATEFSRGACTVIERCESGRIVMTGRRKLVVTEYDLRHELPIPDDTSLIWGVSYNEDGQVLSRLDSGSGEFEVILCDGERLIRVVDNGHVVDEQGGPAGIGRVAE